MDIYDIKKNLQRNSVRMGSVDYYPSNTVDDILDKINLQAIIWTEDDFIQAAIEESNETEWNIYYDKTKFMYALHEMIKNHDSEYGITWDTVKFYLNEYCRIKKYKNIYDKF